MKRYAILTVGILLMATGAFAQATSSDTSDATATIITPITITNSTGLAFGTLAVDASGGTISVSAAGAPSTTGGVTSFGTVAAALFTVTGEAGYTFDVTLGTGATVSDGTNTMTVDTLVASCDAGCALGDLTVGGTLNVGASQAAGTYNTTNALGVPFTVTVNY